MTADPPPPARQRITAPRRAPSARPRWPVVREIDEQTGVGEVYMRSLIRTQLRLALLVCLALVLGLGGLPLLFRLRPGLADLRVLGVPWLPLPWVVLGGAVYPALVVLAWAYVRAAERNERSFAELVGRD